jgi:hypothetical protein
VLGTSEVDIELVTTALVVRLGIVVDVMATVGRVMDPRNVIGA